MGKHKKEKEQQGQEKELQKKETANKSNPIMEKAKKEFAASPYYCELRGMKNGQKDKV